MLFGHKANNQGHCICRLAAGIIYLGFRMKEASVEGVFNLARLFRILFGVRGTTEEDRDTLYCGQILIVDCSSSEAF